jgi:hypothetical protein
MSVCCDGPENRFSRKWDGGSIRLHSVMSTRLRVSWTEGNPEVTMPPCHSCGMGSSVLYENYMGIRGFKVCPECKRTDERVHFVFIVLMVLGIAALVGVLA